MYHVSTSLLRFWEKEFGILHPKKNSRGDRQFTQKDILTVDRIYDLVKLRGFTLEGAKRELRSNNPNKSVDKSLLLQKLIEIRAGLKRLRNDLNQK